MLKREYICKDGTEKIVLFFHNTIETQWRSWKKWSANAESIVGMTTKLCRKMS